MESRGLGRVVLLLLKLVGWFYFVLPSSGQKLCARVLGAVLRLAKIRASVIEQNLVIAYPNDEAKRADLFYRTYEHLGFLLLEVPMIFGPMPWFAKRSTDILGVQNWIKAKESGKGVIFLASHLGNWEVMAASGALQGKIDILFVTKLLKPAWLHEAIEAARLKYNIVGTYEPRTLRDILSQLKKNETVAIVLDQYAGPPIGVRVPFFGVPVGTSTAVATLVKRTGAKILPVLNFRTADGRFQVEIGEPIEWITSSDSKTELALNTSIYAKKIQEMIYQHPEQWLWIHRRFKGNLSALREDEWQGGRARS